MKTTVVPSATDKIALKGFAREDLKEWVYNHGIKDSIFKRLKNYLDGLMESKYAIHFTNGLDKSQHGYYIPGYEIAFGESDEYDVYDCSWLDKPVPHLFSQEEAMDLFVEHLETFAGIGAFNFEQSQKGIISIKPDTLFIKCADGKLDLRAKKFQHDTKDAKVIPCCNLSKKEFKEGFLSGRFRFDEDVEEDASSLNKYLDIIFRYEGYIDIQEYDAARMEKMLEKCRACTKELRELMCFSEESLDKYFSDYLRTRKSLDELQTQIVLHAALMADTQRCQLPAKPYSCLEESGEGHWELCSKDEDAVIQLNGSYMARDPHIDCNEDGFVGIDFGTKSTVVSLRGNDNHAKLIRVGTSTYDARQSPADYENPTVLEFLDILSFMKAYSSKESEGRPCTRFTDIKSSHGAKNDLAKAKSEDLAIFLTDIKQWCGDTTGARVPIIRDYAGKYVEFLPAFVGYRSEIGFDPLEIYAYYLGLSINNVYNGVFLKYVLAAPTTYEKEIRDKMTQSFERGIKRSLPEAIAQDKELMEEFEVKVKCSEPAAYAACALKEYQIRPAKGEKAFYSVFDFGGGTTDMVFGVLRAADPAKREEKRYTWVLDKFKDEGDKYLGGEYLLELMAYEIFACNAPFLGEKCEFSFIKPVKGRNVAGLEKWVNTSLLAKRNMMSLTERLRPLWEGIKEYTGAQENEKNQGYTDRILKGYRLKEGLQKTEEFLAAGFIDLRVVCNSGEMEEVRLYIENDEKDIHVDLVGIIENRIESGVATYIHALREALLDERASGIQKVHLLLAGNASKSPVLKQILQRYIASFASPAGTPVEVKVLPPLGTLESYEEGARFHEGRPDMPTGKTGVAYGLIDTIVRINEETKAEDEAKFKYYLGNNLDDLFVVKVRRDVVYGKWQPMDIPADDNLELYYTPLVDALGGDMDIHRTMRKICRIKNNQKDLDKEFFVRARTPDSIEYGIGSRFEDGLVDEASILSLGIVQLLP